MSGYDAEQRARDRRLAWIVVACCAVVTSGILIASVYALSGSLGDLVEPTAQPRAAVPRLPEIEAPRLDTGNVAVAPAAAGQIQKRSGSAIDPAVRRRDDAARAAELQKGDSRTEDDVGESEGEERGSDGSGARDVERDAADPARRI